MDEKEMKALAAQLAKNLKTEKDLSDFSRQLNKIQDIHKLLDTL